jgi:hypothetical protein
MACFDVLFLHLSGRAEENHETISQIIRYPGRFEIGISQTQSRIANRLTVTFGQDTEDSFECLK